jgi:TRAP transporter TAXI family solute receptor
MKPSHFDACSFVHDARGLEPKCNRALGKDFMTFAALRRGIFGSLVALSLAAAPLCGMSVTETAIAAPAKGKAVKGKAAKASRAGARQAKSGSRGGHRHAWHRHSGGKHGKNSRSSRRHAPQPEADEPDDSVAQATAQAAASPAAKLAPLDNGRAVVSLVTSGVGSTSARIASDLASVLDSDGLRVVPIIGKGTLADLRDLGNSGLGDVALLQSDALANLPRGEREAVSARLSYVARLYNEEVHVVAAREISDLRQLAGRSVNIGREGSSSALTARLIFDRLGIAPKYVQVDQPTALSQLKSGDIAATVMVGGRPIKALSDFASDDRFRLVPIPYEAALQDSYLPTKLASTDYGDLIAPGESVPTVAVGILLATVDAPEGSPRYRRVQRFSEALFSNFEALRDPARHPKWREVNMAAKVSGWTRFKPAQDWLDGRRGIAEARSAGAAPAAAPADEVAPSGVESDDVQQKLYQEYREWKRQREKWRKQ